MDCKYAQKDQIEVLVKEEQHLDQILSKKDKSGSQSPQFNLHKHTIPLEHPEVLLERQQEARDKVKQSEKSCSRKKKIDKENKSRNKSKADKKRSKKEKIHKGDNKEKAPKGDNKETFNKMEIIKKDAVKKNQK